MSPPLVPTATELVTGLGSTLPTLLAASVPPRPLPAPREEGSAGARRGVAEARLYKGGWKSAARQTPPHGSPALPAAPRDRAVPQLHRLVSWGTSPSHPEPWPRGPLNPGWGGQPMKESAEKGAPGRISSGRDLGPEGTGRPSSPRPDWPFRRGLGDRKPLSRNARAVVATATGEPEPAGLQAKGVVGGMGAGPPEVQTRHAAVARGNRECPLPVPRILR